MASLAPQALSPMSEADFPPVLLVPPGELNPADPTPALGDICASISHTYIIIKYILLKFSLSFAFKTIAKSALVAIFVLF